MSHAIHVERLYKCSILGLGNRALQALDLPGFNVIVQALAGFRHPEARTMGQVLSAGTTERSISRLLDLGMLKTEMAVIRAADLDETNTNDLLRYRITPFGEAVLTAYMQACGAVAPEMRILLEEAGRRQFSTPPG